MEKETIENVCFWVDKTFCTNAIKNWEKLLAQKNVDAQCEKTKELILDILTDLWALHHAIITRVEWTKPPAELQDVVDLADNIRKKTWLSLDSVFKARNAIILEMVKIIQKWTDETKENA